MSLRDFLVLYALVGLACGIAAYRRAPQRGPSALVSAVVTVPLWPLWAPFALAPAGAGVKSTRPLSTPILGRVERALAESVAAVAGTPMSEMFTQRTAARIQAEVERVAARLADLDALAAQRGYDRVASGQRLDELEKGGAPERAVATARLQHESLVRLAEMRESDARALDELAELLEVLRTQLVLARFEGSPADDAGMIVTEVWARLEGLGAVTEAPRPPGREARAATSAPATTPDPAAGSDPSAGSAPRTSSRR